MAVRRDEIEAALQAQGLLLRGGFTLDPARDQDLLTQFPEMQQLLLVGNAGSAIWRSLSGFIADHPMAAHPLDQWTEQVLGDIASAIGAVSLFPFGSAPWWPFQRWAQRADTVFPSPVAVLIHPTYGLWHAYRGALLLREPVELPILAPQASPCESCAAKPCLTACPVGAFSTTGYDVEGCATHVHGATGADCRLGGCLARRVCPVGGDWQYEPEHMRFHMQAFLRAHPR